MTAERNRFSLSTFSKMAFLRYHNQYVRDFINHAHFVLQIKFSVKMTHQYFSKHFYCLIFAVRYPKYRFQMAEQLLKLFVTIIPLLINLSSLVESDMGTVFGRHDQYAKKIDIRDFFDLWISGSKTGMRYSTYFYNKIGE